MVEQLPLDQLAEWCREQRIPGIGVLPATVQMLGPESVRELLRDRGIQPTSISAVVGLVAPDPAQDQLLLTNALTTLSHAASLGVPLVVVAGGFDWTRKPAQLRAAARRRLLRLADLANQMGTRILVEPLNSRALALSAFTFHEAEVLVAEHGAMGLVLDTWHAHADLHRQMMVGRVDIIHVADWSPMDGDDDRQIPGSGTLDFPNLIRQFDSGGFTGWWEIEVLSSRVLKQKGPWVLLDESVSATRRLFEEIGEPCD